MTRMTKAALLAHMARLGACIEAKEWVRAAGRKSPARLWESCPRADWLLWLAGAAGVDRKAPVMAACACARTALVRVPAGEVRPLRAIETAEAWCRGEATTEAVRAAAASAAAYASASYAASAASAASAAYAAYASAYASAYARSEALAAMAPIVRASITWEMVAAALEVTP